MRHPEQAAAIALLGVDAVGVIGVRASPRFLALERRRDLFSAVAAAEPSCLGVVVVADPLDQDMKELEVNRGHQVVQLHGDESPERCGELRERLGVSLWKAIRIRNPDDLEHARAYEPVVDALLLDAWVPDQLGGTGHAIPTGWLTNFKPALPWWLAGGITPARLPRLMSELQPDGIDCSSGVETSPGEKDLNKVKELLNILKEFKDKRYASCPRPIPAV